MGIETTKKMTINGNEVSVVELKQFIENLPDGQPIKVMLSGNQMDRTTLTFTTKL